MSTNERLHRAKGAKHDEFYTQLEDIEKELEHYKAHFEGQVVYVSCDNPDISAFWEYFHRHFAELKLKKLISTHYDFCDPTYKVEYEGGDDDNLSAGTSTPLYQFGDFRSEECVEILNTADIVVTNPPFSLFRDFVYQLMLYKKKFIVWGNNNAITYKDLFIWLKNNEVWLGYTVNKNCVFRLGADYGQCDEKLTSQKNDGNRYARVPSITVFTNLDIPKRHERLVLTKTYNSTEYPIYNNFDAIEVPKIELIPSDYMGIMGVPITFMDKYCPEQFEIIGHEHDIAGNGGEGVVRGQFEIDGVGKYKRILIRRKGS